MNTKIKYKQPTGHNCGLYAISNIFDDDGIINDVRCEYGKNGHTINDLNIYLREDGKDYYVETLYKNIFNTQLPVEAHVWPTSNIDTIPLLLTVAFELGGVNHIVGLRVISDRTVYLYDSLREYVIETDFASLHDFYPIIFGVFAFKSYDPTNEGYVSFIQ